MEIKVLASSSKGNCIYISDNHTPLLLDCGLPFKEIQRRLNFTVSELAGTLITHSHLDHCRGAKGLTEAGINVFASAETLNTLKLLGHRAYAIEPLKQFRLGTWAIKSFPAVHDVPCLGFLLASENGKVVYLIDSAYSKYRFPGVTHWLLGCNYSEELIHENVANSSVDRQLKRRIIQNHMSLSTLESFLRANDLSKVKEIYLLHLSDTNSSASLFKQKVQEIVGVPVYIGGKS